MPSWGRERGARLGQLRAQMAADEDMVQFDKDDPDFLPRQPADGIHGYRSELGLLEATGGLADPTHSAISRVRRFFDSLNQSGSSALEDRSPVPTDRRSLLLRRYLHRHRLQHSRSSPGRAANAANAANAAKPADSPWPSPARGRRQPALRDVHSTSELLLGEDALSSASSLTNVSTISSSIVGGELDLDNWEDDPQDDEHFSGPDWVPCEYSATQLTVDTRCSSAASSFQSGIHFTARAGTTASSVSSGIHFTVKPATGPSSVGSGIQFTCDIRSSSVDSCGITFGAPTTMEPEEYAPNTLTEEYGKMLTLEDLKDYNSSCLSCGVSWRNEEASLDCNECGGYTLHRPCPECSGKCGATWRRDLTKSHDKAMAAWTGACRFQPSKGLCQHIKDLQPNS